MSADMQQIAGLFNDCIEAIRDEKHDNLEQMAIDWLKGGRIRLMRSIEAEYYKLAASRGNPTRQEGWALNSCDTLFISVDGLPPILRPYSSAIRSNIQELMDSCGFNSTVSAVPSAGSDFFAVKIRFPDRLTNAHNERIPRILHVKDSIDTTLAINFARLIEGGDENGDPSNGWD